MTGFDTDPGHRPGDIVHVVLLRLHDAATDADRLEVDRRFRALADTERDGRRYIRRIRSGPQISPEGEPHGFELGFVVEFDSEGDRNHYLGRPFVAEDAGFDLEHDAFKQFVGPLLAQDDGVLVFDFVDGGWTREREAA